MARTAVDPWHSPSAIAALSARKQPITREAWLAMLTSVLEEHGTQGNAAVALAMSHRQFARWIAWLRENEPKAAARLPEMPVGGRPRAEAPEPAPAAPVRKKRQRP